MRNRRVDGVEGGEEVSLHGALVGFERLIFKGPDFDDACIVDEEVEAAEGFDGLGDQFFCLFGVGQVAGDEENIVLVLNAAGQEQGLACGLEFFFVACGENEFEAGLTKTVRDGKAKAAGTAGDDGHLGWMEALAAGDERVSGSGCNGGKDDRQGELGGGLAHGQ